MTLLKSGFIAILGRPNVGKSTLFNRLIGDKIAIVSDKPQTTRNKILGIKNMEGGQLIFLDTPGNSHGGVGAEPADGADRYCFRPDADVLLFLTDGASPLVEKDKKMLKFLETERGIPFLVINKIDLMERKNLLPLIDQYQHLHPFKQIHPVSATTGEGIDTLVREMLNVLPESPPYFPEDVLTDQTERAWVAEIIREKIIQQTYQEIPHAVAVTIDEFKERPEKNLVVIKGTIHVERDSQKKILIGKGGQKLKKIGEAARKETEAFLGKKVFLELWANVEKNWTRDPKALSRLGYPSS